MQYSLRSLMLIGQVELVTALMGCVISIVFALTGLAIVLLPSAMIFKWDQRWGYWRFLLGLKISGDVKQAVTNTVFVYRAFGALFVLMGTCQFLFWLLVGWP